MLSEVFGESPWWSLTLYGITACGLYYLWATFQSERKIRALGGHTVILPSWTPFGLNHTYVIVKHQLQLKNVEFWQRIFGQAGQYTLEQNLGGQRFIMTSDPENIKALLATQFKDFGKGEEFRKDWHPFLGDGIFTTDGDMWHKSRQMIRPQFIKDRISDLATFERHVTKLMSLIPRNGQTVDICDLFFRYTLDAATDFLLGGSVRSLDNPQTRFALAFQQAQHTNNMITLLGPMKIFLPKSKYYEAIRTLDEFVNPLIERALLLSPEELEKKTKSESDYTFLHEVAKYTRDRKQIRDQIVNVLLAGRDTTASTLSWLFYELSKYPETVKKLRQEIIDRVGPTRAPTYEDLKSMRYLNNAINETLRLYPAVPANVRAAACDTTLPRGGGKDGLGPFGVPKGTPIAYSVLTLHRRPDFQPLGYPIPADEFSVERWSDWQPTPWTYIPFNGGPRICVGQQFALTEIAYTVVRILQKFDMIEPRYADGEVRMRSEVVLVPDKGIKVAMHAV